MRHALSIIGARLYDRVSADPQGLGRSVDEQDNDNRRTCQTNHWPILGRYTDNDIGASRYSGGKARPEWERLLDDLRPGEVVVTWEASRATRDMKVYQALADACEELGAYWCYSGRLYDLADPEDQFTTGLEVLLSAREAAMIRKRVRRAISANLADGKPHGQTPYGYTAVRDSAGRLLAWVINPETSAVILEAVKRVLEYGETLGAICRDFNERGIPGPGKPHRRNRDKREHTPWTNPSLRRCLLSPTIAGFRVHERQIARRGTWDAIITEDDHYRLRAILEDSSRLLHKGSTPKNLLRSIGVHDCGAIITTRTNHGHQYYKCSDGHPLTIRTDYIDPYVSEVVIQWLERFDVAGYAAKTDPNAKADIQELEALRARLTEFEDKAIAGEITAEFYARFETKILSQIEALETRLQSVNTPVAGLESITGKKARKAWENLPMQKRRELISAIVTVTIHTPTDGPVKQVRADLVTFSNWLH